MTKLKKALFVACIIIYVTNGAILVPLTKNGKLIIAIWISSMVFANYTLNKKLS